MSAVRRPIVLAVSAFVVGVVVAATVAVAPAAAVDTVTTPTVCANSPLAVLTWTKPLTLPQFDPALGALQSVAITGQVDLQAKFSGENLDQQPATFTVNEDVTASLTVPAVATATATGKISMTFKDVPAFDGTDDKAGPSSFNSGATPLTAFAAFAPVSLSTSLGSYIGTGTWSSSVHAEGTASLSGSSNAHFQVDSSGKGQVCVAYSYVPTPPTTTAPPTTTLPPTTTEVPSTTVAVLPPTLPPPTTVSGAVLPPTGRTDDHLAVWAAAFVGLGLVAVGSVRRRSDAPRSR